jgi:ribonuclease PH
MSDVAPRTTRATNELRHVKLERGVAPYAEGSCLVSFGHTRVLCTATVEETLPDWRKHAGAGWVTAEYAMLPRATHKRTRRERNSVGGRTQEIQRLIGRALRASVDMKALGERQIVVDCDVIVADGGTRTASITGAAVAVYEACLWLQRQQRITAMPMRELVAAVSVGVIGGQPRLDLEYSEDVIADVDMNLVALESGGLVEVQGTAEHNSYSRAELEVLLDVGLRGIADLIELQRGALGL